MDSNYSLFFSSSSSLSSSPVPAASTSHHYPSNYMMNSSGFSDFFHDKSIQNGSQGSLPPPSSMSDTNSQSSGSNGDGLEKSDTKKVEKKVRNPRCAFQTRSHVDILDDGYRWRKYGQKAVKNNKHPRSYYRCTHQGCNVKKQVQRLSKDEGIVVTTYDGMHTHPIEKTTDNFENILNQMQIYTGY